MKQVHLIPALDDNYIFCLQNGDQALIVDPGEAGPVLKFLKERGLRLDGVLVTHHHHDHINGVNDLTEEHPCPVWLPAGDQNRLPFEGKPLREGDQVSCAGFEFKIWELPGHTLNHISYFEKNEHWMFSGDVLFGFGCGRLFEGTYDQAHHSLQRFLSLPRDTKIYCTHEYTFSNLRFLETLPLGKETQADFQSLLSEQKKRLHDEGATVPLKLSEQIEWNPFLKAKSVEEFQTLRVSRNNF